MNNIYKIIISFILILICIVDSMCNSYVSAYDDIVEEEVKVAEFKLWKKVKKIGNNWWEFWEGAGENTYDAKEEWIDFWEGVGEDAYDVTHKWIDFWSGVGETIYDIKDAIDTFSKNFAHNPLGTLGTILLNLVLKGLDGVQMLMNTVQTTSLNTASDWNILYELYYLRDDGMERHIDKGAGNRDIYTKVSGYKSNVENEKNLINVGDSEYYYVPDVPVIPADIYYIASNQVTFLDTNFLKVSDKHQNDNAWIFIRNLVTNIIHITIYISAAILIVLLIINGIKIVIYSINNPEKNAQQHEILNRFATSVGMLVGTVVIMALCIYGNEALIKIVKVGDDTYEGPIRVNVLFANTSFSTTPTGYFRYVAQIEDVDRCIEKAKYTFIYFGLVLANAVCMIVMLVRMGILILLSIMGPINVVRACISNNANTIYANWAILYAKTTFIQAAIMILYKIFFELAM